MKQAILFSPKFEKQLGDSSPLYIEKWSDNVVRIHNRPSSSPSFAVETPLPVDGIWEPESVSADHSGQTIFRTSTLRILFDEEQHLTITTPEGAPLLEEYTDPVFSPEQISPEELELMIQEGHTVHGQDDSCKFTLHHRLFGDESFYGLGEKTGFLDKKGYCYTMWNTDNPDPHVENRTFEALYQSIPFFITLREGCAFGLFLDNHYKTYFDMGCESTEYYSISAADGYLDLYFLYGPDLQNVLEQYTWLTGRPPLPQLWTLGYHQSRWGYSSQQEVLDLARSFRNHDIPCDVIHMDIDYMDNYKVFTKDTSRFPDLKKLSDELARMGIKLVTIIDPGTKVEEGYSVYDDGVKNNYFALDSHGEIYQNVVWPGDSVFPDFTSQTVRDWWGEHTRFQVENGIRGIWNDMNEPASFNGPLPDDVVFPGDNHPRLHKEVHNVYGHLMAKATYEGLKKQDGRRPFVITRACYSGTQKYSTAWTGDNQSLWSHLKMSIPQLLNLGLSGMPIVGTDIGGFGENTTPELLCRWVEASCFSPLFRNHCAKYSRLQEPWQFDQETLDINRKYIRLHYRFLPYLYDLFYNCSQTGVPILRPLLMYDQNDPALRQCNDEYMVGDSLLVAPVTDQGARARIIYLPKGLWIDYWTEERIEGGRYILREAPLDTCPIYVRAGSLIPVWPPVDHIPEHGLQDLILLYYPETESTDSRPYTHYQDNGVDFDYETGSYNLFTYQVVNGNLVTTTIHDGYTDMPLTVRVEQH